MTIEQLRSVHQARPFRPFVMHLADGDEISVPSPEFMLTTPSGRTAFVVQADDTLNIIDLVLVKDLEIKPGEIAPGKRRRT